MSKHRAASFIPGVETQIASARSAQRNKPIIVSLSMAERHFLLYRMADRTASIEAVLHEQRTGELCSPRDRDTVADHLNGMTRVLHRPGHGLIVISTLDKLPVIQAIERNPYFAQMRDTGPRLNIGAVRKAGALRQRLAALFDRPIARIPPGAGRTRLVDPAMPEEGQHERPVA
jgi:hypothetical protein